MQISPALALLAILAAPGGELPVTTFQTNVDYDPRLDLKTDAVIVHQHGRAPDQVKRSIESWRAAGYAVHRMFFIGSDAGSHYTAGRFDGKPHLDEAETGPDGKPLTIGGPGGRPYMVPTEGWRRYLRGFIDDALDAGATAICPEEPLMHGRSGYGDAFKAEWERAYGEPWQDPQSSPTAYWRASRLKAQLYLDAVRDLAMYTREQGARRGQPARFILPVHSPVSYASWGLIFPHSAAAAIPEVDGILAQVWTGPARAPVTFEGRSEPRFFESAWMLYSYFANLMAGRPERATYFLADPVEDDPNYGWAQYEQWYQRVLTASLLFPEVSRYEVMPWPDRIYLPGYRMGEGTPGPADYLTQLSGIVGALQRMPEQREVEWESGARGIGVIVLDTMMWQRGGPAGSSMATLHGLAMPLLARGVPAQIVPLERAPEAGFLDRFDLLLLSYDVQKPLDPRLHEALAAWVRRGGVLLLWGGDDAYNDVGEWWSRDGFPSPQEHLLKLLGGPDPGTRRVARGDDGFRELARADAPYRSLENRRRYHLDLAPLRREGKVAVRFSDAYPQDGWGPWLAHVRVTVGERVVAEFVPGTEAEKPFLRADHGSQVRADFRFADADASFTYVFAIGEGADREERPAARTEPRPPGPAPRMSGNAITLEVDMGNQFVVSAGPADTTTEAWEALAKGLPPLHLAPAQGFVAYRPKEGVSALYRRKESRPEALPLLEWRAGKGAVVFCGLPARYGASSPEGAALVRGLVRRGLARVAKPYRESGSLVLRRGDFRIAWAGSAPVRVPGRFLDLFHPELPLRTDPRLDPGQVGFFRDVTAHLKGDTPRLLFASHRTRVLGEKPEETLLECSGPQGVRGTARLYRGSRRLASIEAIRPDGTRPDVTAREEGETLLLRFPLEAQGMTVTLRWET